MCVVTGAAGICQMDVGAGPCFSYRFYLKHLVYIIYNLLQCTYISCNCDEIHSKHNMLEQTFYCVRHDSSS